MADLSEEPPTDINPYDVLQLETTASSSDVKSAYKKLALIHHPDKVQSHERDSAHSRFQEIAFAYAILSDERRRSRYDATGNTSESLDIADDNFNWSEFFKAQWADAVTVEKLNDFKSTYQHSEEERQDVLKAYISRKGDLDQVFTRIMLSNPLEDEVRFRAIINDAIAKDEVEAYEAFTHEKEIKKKKRHQRACGEGLEAQEYAKKLGVWDDLFGNAKDKTKTRSKDDGAGLMELIQKRKRGASSQFLDNLEAKYGGGQRKGKKQKFEEPPEALFQQNRHKVQKPPIDEAEVDIIEDDVDLGDDSSESDVQDRLTQSKRKSANDLERPNKRTVNRTLGARNKENSKPAKSKRDGVKGAAKKKIPQDDVTRSAAKSDDEAENIPPSKAESKATKDLGARSSRSAKKSYVEAGSSHSDSEDGEEEEESKPPKSKGKSASGAKGSKGRTKYAHKSERISR